MNDSGFALFDTAIGVCGIGWGDRGIRFLQLPEAGERATRARIRRRFSDLEESEPPAQVSQVIAAIVALLRGEKTDLTGVGLDMRDVPDFNRRVYDVARSIPAGETLTYGDVAKRLGDPTAARAVGQALGQNPFAIIVPCHRVLGADRKPGGFSAGGGVKTKLKILSIEKARIGGSRDLFDLV
ncbi:MAG: methylated-DNA--[protein]-cysteine S-methyltransferase [Bradyrhizobiaceae bacterium]|nr:methylated-DNA--[protein]-cysteine S-methyltransferase [Bradyrhizobiaceae bacterium]